MFKRTLFILLSLILVLTLSIGNIALAAQDYNSSRSNKPRPLVPKDSIDDKGESGEKIDKEDHNIKELKR